MSRLLRGASVPVGIHGPVARVAFQQGNEGFPLDDVVAWGHADPPAIPPSIQIQVKRRVRATAGDPEFVKVMAAAAAACGGQPEQFAARQMHLGLAARRSRGDHIDELTELTDMARAHEAPETFGNLFRPGVTGKPLCDRLSEVSAAVATAVDGHDALVVGQLTHRILRALHVWPVEDGPDGRDWRDELDGLTDLATEAGKSPADVMAQLRLIAGQFGPRSSNVDAEHVRAQLARFGVYLPTTSTGIRRPGSQTIINANDNSTVFNGHIQNFGAFHFRGGPGTPGTESGTS